MNINICPYNYLKRHRSNNSLIKKMYRSNSFEYKKNEKQVSRHFTFS